MASRKITEFDNGGLTIKIRFNSELQEFSAIPYNGPTRLHSDYIYYTNCKEDCIRTAQNPAFVAGIDKKNVAVPFKK